MYVKCCIENSYRYIRLLRLFHPIPTELFIMNFGLACLLCAHAVASDNKEIISTRSFITSALNSHPQWFSHYGSSRGFMRGPSGDQFTNAAVDYLYTPGGAIDETLIPLLEKALRIIEEPVKREIELDVNRVGSNLRQFLDLEDLSSKFDSVEALQSAITKRVEEAAFTRESMDSADYIHGALVVLGSMHSSQNPLSPADKVFREKLAKRLLEKSIEQRPSVTSPAPSHSPVTHGESSSITTQDVDALESVTFSVEIHSSPIDEQDDVSRIKQKALLVLMELWGPREPYVGMIFSDAISLCDTLDVERLSWLAALEPVYSLSDDMREVVREWISCEQPDINVLFSEVMDEIEAYHAEDDILEDDETDQHFLRHREEQESLMRAYMRAYPVQSSFSI